MINMHLTNSGPKNCAIISYMPHNVCNYSCTYCSAWHNDGSNRWNIDYTSPANFVNEIRVKNKYVYIEILGGEPTLWPNLQNFINEICHDNVVIELNTNGSRTLRYWQDFKKANYIINFTWHSAEADTLHLYEVVKIMKDKSYSCVTFMMTPENFNIAKDAILLFETLGVQIDVKPTRINIGSSELYPFTNEQLQYITEYKNDWKNINTPVWWNLYPKDIKINNALPEPWYKIVIEKQNIYTNWTCTAGLNRFTIDPLGNINRCYQNIGGSIGNVFTGYTLPTDAVICTFADQCSCKLDAMVEKWSPDV